MSSPCYYSLWHHFHLRAVLVLATVTPSMTTAPSSFHCALLRDFAFVHFFFALTASRMFRILLQWLHDVHLILMPDLCLLSTPDDFWMHARLWLQGRNCTVHWQMHVCTLRFRSAICYFKLPCSLHLQGVFWAVIMALWKHQTPAFYCFIAIASFSFFSYDPLGLSLYTCQIYGRN